MKVVSWKSAAARERIDLSVGFGGGSQGWRIVDGRTWLVMTVYER